MRLTEEDAKLQRESIIRAAFEIFTTVGYAGTKMEMISKKAKISRSPLYYYYSSKLELFTQVCRLYFDFYLEKMERLYVEKPEETIYTRYYHLFLESRSADYVYGNQLSNQILQGGEEMSGLLQMHDDYWKALREKDMKALMRSQSRGEIRADSNLKAILNYYYTVYHGLRAPKLKQEFADYNVLENVCYTSVRMMESLYAPEGWVCDRFRDAKIEKK